MVTQPLIDINTFGIISEQRLGSKKKETEFIIGYMTQSVKNFTKFPNGLQVGSAFKIFGRMK